MIITCPECSTNYQVDAAKFPAAGRKVKCAKCGHSWHQAAPEPEPVVEVETPAPEPEPEIAAPEPAAPEPVAEPEPAPEPVPSRVTAYSPEPEFETPGPTHATVEDTAPRRPSRWPQRFGVLIGWGLFVAIIAVGVFAAVTYRQSIATAWPQTASLYGMIGMPVNARGIDFEEVAYRKEKQDGQSVLAITGKLVNISGREQPVPQIRAALSNEEGRELYHWTFSAGITTMKPGQSVKFLTRISSPPPGAMNLDVRFARDGE
jgi:predicted Zn finger-like uncharacterized protein